MDLNTLEFTAVIALGSSLAGFLGSLTGLGGGIVIVPLLTLVFGVDIRYAIELLWFPSLRLRERRRLMSGKAIAI